MIARHGLSPTLTAGFATQAVGLGWWTAELHRSGPLLVAFVLPMVLWCLGLGVTIVVSFVICTSGVAGDLAGVAAGLVTTSLNIGGAIGLALIGPAAQLTGATLTGYAIAALCVAVLSVAGAALSVVRAAFI